MKKRFALAALILGFGLGWNLALGQNEQKMNLLFIITDQQQYHTSKAYGNEVIRTPALDELAANSLVFQNAYVTQPLCSPSRGSLMTGLYPHTHGVINNDLTLPEDLPVLPQMLDEAYETAYIGKWHLGDEIFQQRDFDQWISMEDGYYKEYGSERNHDARSDYHHWLVEKGYKPNNAEKNRFSRRYAASLPIEHCKPAFLEEKAVEFLDSAGDQPFVMYVSFLEPHKPFTGPLNGIYSPEEVLLPDSYHSSLDENDPRRYHQIVEKVKQQYGGTEQEIRELLAKYWGLITQVDRSVGNILDKLESEGLDDNTIVVFTSDHGSMMGAHGMVSKSVMYEESVRIPLMLRDPRMKNASRTIKERVSQIDLLPTLLELMNCEVPDGLHGESLVPFLEDKIELEKDVIVEWPSVRTIITQDGWKLTLFEQDKSQLFDLRIDPKETCNLFSKEEYRDTIKELSRRILVWQHAVGDPEMVSDIHPDTVKAWSAPYRRWHYYPDHVIAPEPGIPGFEKVHMTDVPTVFQLPGDPRWYMSFIGFDGAGYQSFIAESNDLLHWTHLRLAMGYGPEGSFDHGGVVLGAYLYEDYNIRAPRILKKVGDKYYSLYGAYPRQGGYELRPGGEGVAFSQNGILWERAKEEPILSVYQKDIGPWEKDCIYQPWLLQHGDQYLNYYNAANGTMEQLGLARSDDLLNWKRYAANPVIPNGPAGSYNELFSSDGKVFKDSDHWVMFFFGVGTGEHKGAHIMAAFSRDLQHWTVDPEPLYKRGGNPSGLDEKHAHKISLVWNPENETFYMFYNAVGPQGRGIGLITSKPLNYEN